jgi:hypothetical protein
MALPANIPFVWIGFPRKNTLAYHEKLINYCLKMLYNIEPRC